MKNGAKNATAQRMKMMSAFFILFYFFDFFRQNDVRTYFLHMSRCTYGVS